MKNIEDILTVSYESGLEGESALCVARKKGEKKTILKIEIGEQADILYYLLTEQIAKAEMKKKSEGK